MITETIRVRQILADRSADDRTGSLSPVSLMDVTFAKAPASKSPGLGPSAIDLFGSPARRRLATPT
jgi:hypothetical protein